MADGGVEYHNAEMANDREPGHGRQVEVRRGRTYLAFQGLPHRIILFQEEKNKKRSRSGTSTCNPELMMGVKQIPGVC